MAECERFAVCNFLDDLRFLPKTAHRFVETYCRGEQKDFCARYMVAAAGLKPPRALYPNEQERAMRMIRIGRVADEADR